MKQVFVVLDVRHQPNGVTDLRPIIIIILVVSVLTGGWYWLFTEPPSHDQLYVRYNQSYPNVTDVLDNPYKQLQGGGERAFFLYRKGEYEMAANAFERFLKRDPDNILYLFYKGQSEMQNGSPDTAVSYFEKVLAKDKKQSAFYEPARWYAALCHLKRGNIKQTRELLQQVKKRNNTYAERAENLLANL